MALDRRTVNVASDVPSLPSATATSATDRRGGLATTGRSHESKLPPNGRVASGGQVPTVIWLSSAASEPLGRNEPVNGAAPLSGAGASSSKTVSRRSAPTNSAVIGARLTRVPAGE